ncbi:hypothetical protein DM01DRAFT_1365526 [Hesseltinella vesiculosa]|uniref:C4-dicarboxylate transporter/malic acid transport protein n=1 Tax=Hesseltinella vesiculosa TaxID=101127 RepID=A0A1X2GWN2_9FUNG|nr:hypothetical protein DM01DRAFT_1365526 [Hesseltinella vesiculosa]
MALKDKIKHFTPSWFSMSQSTGIISLLLATCPYQFPGLEAISSVFFFLNVVIFLVFALMTMARYIMFPHILTLMLNHSVVLTVLSVVIVPYYIIIHHNHQLERMNGTWLLPIVPAVVTAASGGLIAQHLVNPMHAKIVIITSFFLMGIGILLALSIIVIYFHRLVVHKLPSNEVIISAFLPLGPLGQGAYGFLQLGKASQLWFSSPSNLVPDLGPAMHASCIVWAMLLWGFGLWFLVVAVFSVGATYQQTKNVPFNMGWWGLIFPFGVFTSATVALGAIWQSSFFNILATVFIVILVILWIMVTLLTAQGALCGKMFVAPCLTPVTNPE